MSKNNTLTNRYTTRYKRWKIFKNFHFCSRRVVKNYVRQLRRLCSNKRDKVMVLQIEGVKLSSGITDYRLQFFYFDTSETWK